MNWEVPKYVSLSKEAIPRYPNPKASGLGSLRSWVLLDSTVSVTIMSHQEQVPEATDLSHHLSIVAKARSVSPLEELQKYFGREGIISLDGGS